MKREEEEREHKAEWRRKVSIGREGRGRGVSERM